LKHLFLVIDLCFGKVYLVLHLLSQSLDVIHVGRELLLEGLEEGDPQLFPPYDR
jgi:hypothetical protein